MSELAVWGIVPVKTLAESKRRLAPALAPAERLALSRWLLEHTLQVLRATRGLAGVLVVSCDPLALEMAGRGGARSLPEEPAQGLNPALEQATRAAQAAGAGGVLVLPIDLPLVEPADLELALDLLCPPGGAGPAVVAAPDRRQEGTNLLAVRPAGGLAYHFGAGSLEHHRAACLGRGIPFHTVESQRLALDIDGPDDLALLEAAGWRIS